MEEPLVISTTPPTSAPIPTSSSPIQRKVYPSCTLKDPTFSGIDPILNLANTRGFIDNCDLYDLPSQYLSDSLVSQYMAIYNHSHFIIGSLMRLLGLLGVTMVLLVLLSTLLQYADPLLLKYMIKLISDPLAKASGVYILVGAALVVLLLRTVCEQHSTHVTYLCSAKTTNSIFGLLYSKTLRISNAAKSLLGTGKIMNILHNDAKVVANCIYGFNDLWTIPIEIAVSLTLLYQEIQMYAFMGAAIIGLGVVIQKLVYNKYTILRRKMYKYTDGRTKYLNEYFEGIKVIKSNAWEGFACNNIKSARINEAGLQFKADMLKVVNEIMIPLFMIITILIIYLWEGRALNPERTFTVLALYKKLESPLSSISGVFSWYAKFRLSLQRIELYLKTPESVEALHYYENGEQPATGKYKPPYAPGEVHLNNCTYAWVDRSTINHAEQVRTLLKKGKTGEAKTATSSLARFSTAPCLQDINLHIRKGELIAVVGEIGSGKTALLQGIIGELIRVRGCEEIGGCVRYVPQVPWIINSTMEYNICLNRARSGGNSKERYDAVFADCDLDVDVRLFPERDQIEIGSRGLGLSGGQRARVGIAREIYSDGDVFLFDDCLSALDPQVASKIFNRVIMNGLEKKTRIFVTHGFHLLTQVPRIVVLKEGRVVEEGSYAELMTKNGEFVRLHSGSKAGSLYDQRASKKTVTKLSKTKAKEKEISRPKENVPVKVKGTLSHKESKATGSIDWKYYIQLIRYGGVVKSVFALFAFFAVDIIMALIQWWLAMWTTNNFERGIWFYTAVYLTLSLLYCLSLLLRKLVVAYFQYSVSIESQVQLVTTLLHTPSSWFDYTPVGRIVNRAVKDQSIVDYLGASIASTAQKLVSLIVTFFVIGIITPYFLVLLGGLVVLYVYWYNYSIQAARDARRLTSINHSPMYGLFNEILDGLVNIRLANLEEIFLCRQHQYLDASMRSFIFKAYCSRWINLRIEILGAFAVAGASIFLALEKGAILGSIAGFSLLNSISIANKLGALLLAATEVETNMSSMERVCEYIYYNPQEKSHEEPVPLKNWPESGRVTINGLSIGYQPNSRLALIDVSFNVNPGEKVGVVGRTGSGKSTLTLALLRILEPYHNGRKDAGQKCIAVDGVDAEKVGLRYLRSSIGIIGQEPVLFSGTVRSNLDPFNLHQDADIINALSKVKILPLLKRKLEEEEEGEIPKNVAGSENELANRSMNEKEKEECIDVLKLTVRERGENFSLGERQLICLARALIRRTKILIMDEATASVDDATDWRIHEMIRKEFRSTTVFIIAHRVKNLLDCDKILVLDEGKVADFDTPENLIKKKTGFFYDSLQQSVASPSN